MSKPNGFIATAFILAAFVALLASLLTYTTLASKQKAPASGEIFGKVWLQTIPGTIPVFPRGMPSINPIPKPEPYPRLKLVVKNDAGETAGLATTNVDGNYRVSLPAGQYKFCYPVPELQGSPESCNSDILNVVAGQRTEYNFTVTIPLP